MKLNEAVFKCTCGCSALLLEHDPEDDYLEMAYLQRYPTKTWSWRLRHAWHALRGKVYSDMVILDKETIADLVDYLIKIQND